MKLILLLIIHLVLVVKISCQCTDVSQFVEKNVGLTATQFWTHKAQDVKQCMQMCVRRKPCRSITYNFINHQCELNSGTKADTPTRNGESIVYSEFDWWNQEIDEHCYSRPCAENEICIPGNKFTTESCQYSCMLAGRGVCPMPVGGVTAGRGVGDINVFTCEHGYIGSDSAICQENQQWSKVLNSVCTEIHNHACTDGTICQPIDAICDGGICICSPDKMYDSNARMCVILPCGIPPTINGTTTKLIDTSSVLYECKDPLQPADGIVDTGIITCTLGTWVTTDFKCFGVQLIQDSSVNTIDGLVVGYLQVFFSGWKNVQFEHWSWQATEVACRQLGYNFGGSYHWKWYDKENPSPATLGTAKLKDIVCTGTETSLDACDYTLEDHGDHTKDLVLSCFQFDVTAKQHVFLKGGSSAMLGQVWVEIGTRRLPLCEKDWNNDVTEVACKTLNQKWSGDNKGKTSIDTQDQPFASKFFCDGTEPHLFFCRNQGWGYVDSSNCGTGDFTEIELWGCFMPAVCA